MCCTDRPIRPGRRTRDRGGFTFIEIMIVVVIIGILAGTVTLTASHYLDRAKRNRARSDIATYCSAMASFYADNGRYPTSEEGLAAVVPKYVDKLRMDPWGHPYAYDRPGSNGPFDVVCFGANGKEGGQGVDADISSDDLDAREPAK